MNVKVNLQDLLAASQQLDGVGDKYGTVITNVQSLAGLSDVFETGAVSGAWSEMVNTYWGYCADSANNLHKTSRTLIRYINATCAQDDAAAQDLLNDVKDYNEAQKNTDEGQGGKPSEPLPEPDLDDPDGVIDEPKYEDAPRPEGDN